MFISALLDLYKCNQPCHTLSQYLWNDKLSLTQILSELSTCILLGSSITEKKLSNWIIELTYCISELSMWIGELTYLIR